MELQDLPLGPIKLDELQQIDAFGVIELIKLCREYFRVLILVKLHLFFVVWFRSRVNLHQLARFWLKRKTLV